MPLAVSSPPKPKLAQPPLSLLLDTPPPQYSCVRVKRYCGSVDRSSMVNSSSVPSSSVGTDGSGTSQPKSSAAPWYLIWMYAIT